MFYGCIGEARLALVGLTDMLWTEEHRGGGASRGARLGAQGGPPSRLWPRRVQHGAHVLAAAYVESAAATLPSTYDDSEVVHPLLVKMRQNKLCQNCVSYMVWVWDDAQGLCWA